MTANNIMPCRCLAQHPALVADWIEGVLLIRVVCGCGTSGPRRTRGIDAIAAWNRMSLAVQIADAGKRCEEELDGSRKGGNFRQELRRLLEQWEVDDEDDPDA